MLRKNVKLKKNICLFRANAIIQKDATMAFYNEKEQLHRCIETDVVGVGLRLVSFKQGMEHSS